MVWQPKELYCSPNACVTSIYVAFFIILPQLGIVLANLFLLSQQNNSPDDVGGSNGQGASHLHINSMIQRYKLFF